MILADDDGSENHYTMSKLKALLRQTIRLELTATNLNWD